MDDYDEQCKRIAALFDEDEPPAVDFETLVKYQVYLEDNLKQPCLLTGIEDFDWEERFLFGYGSKQEYEILKKTQPSFKDTFKFLKFEDETDEFYGVMVSVRRVSDKKKFTLPLADLECTDKNSGNYQLIHDYVVWFVNNR